MKRKLLIAALVLVALIAAGAWYASRRLEPVARQKIVKLLSEHYRANVQLDALHISLFPQLHVEGEGLTLQQEGVPPLIHIAKFTASAGYTALLGTSRNVRSVTLEGLEIRIKKGSKPEAKKGGADAPPFLIGEIHADGTVLEIIPADPAKDPLRFDIYKLKLESVGTGQPMTYTAQLKNAKPPGLIDATGTFGPWNTDDAGQTPLTGDYKFSNADLSVFNGIAGTLASTGQFKGQLDHIEVNGETDVPDFAVKVAGHPVHLKTTFEATVDGTSGDTFLHPVDATFGTTKIHCEGEVAQKAGTKGKTVSLDATVAQGRLEDVLRLGTKSATPMRGAIAFKTKIVIPPGDVDIARKLYLKGTFGIVNAKFTNADVQSKIQQLSNRAQGHPKEGDEGDAATNMKGRFELNHGSVGLSGLAFAVPGADITLDGSYKMQSEDLDFIGTARLDAKVSQTVTGFKSVLLKAVDPFFKKEGYGAVIPIKIGGTREHPTFGLRRRSDAEKK